MSRKNSDDDRRKHDNGNADRCGERTAATGWGRIRLGAGGRIFHNVLSRVSAVTAAKRAHPMWLSIAGTIAALILAVLAIARSRSAGGYYDAEIYGMTPVAHRRYATFAAGFAIFFLAMIALHATAIAWAGLAAFTLFAIFYLTSFLRGFSDDDV